MSDHTSPVIFAALFERLAAGDPVTPEWLWDRMNGSHYGWPCSTLDFSPEDLGCDRALVQLGLARRCSSCTSNDDEEVLVYGPPGSACDECGEVP